MSIAPGRGFEPLRARGPTGYLVSFPAPSQIASHDLDTGPHTLIVRKASALTTLPPRLFKETTSYPKKDFHFPKEEPKSLLKLYRLFNCRL